MEVICDKQDKCTAKSEYHCGTCLNNERRNYYKAEPDPSGNVPVWPYNPYGTGDYWPYTPYPSYPVITYSGYTDSGYTDITFSG